MADNEKHLVRHWKGSRASYNFLKQANRLDPWTRYTVIDTVGDESIIVEYFGVNVVSHPTGQLLPVSAIVTTAPLVSDAHPYDRYLVGSDANGYKVVQYEPKTTAQGIVLVKTELPFDYKYGVRVIDKGLKNYVYVNGKLVTYDDVDCGTF